MMKNIIIRVFFKLIVLLVIASCSSSQSVVKKEKCPKLYYRNYSKILNEEYKTIINSDTISFNEIRFQCVVSALLTHKVMFDKFGKWDEEVYPANKKHPVLMWKKLDLFSNGKGYDVYTNGKEKAGIYASVMVFDEVDNDLLTRESMEKEKLTNYFSELIKNNKMKKRDFYEVYWTIVDSAHWKRIKGLK